jgi:hypothetical protein
MTAEEKAWDLFTKFNKDGLHQISSVINRHVRREMIKQCALIAVDEMLDELSNEDLYKKSNYIFWQEVKQEIEKL